MHDLSDTGVVVIHGDVLIEDNIIEAAGTIRFNHGLYSNDHTECNGVADVTVRGNFFRNNPGAGIEINAPGRPSSLGVRDFLWENNILENNSRSLELYHNTNDGVIRNHTIIQTSYPTSATDSQTPILLAMFSTVKGNDISNNIFYSTMPGTICLYSDSTNCSPNTVDYNLWNVTFNTWAWLGVVFRKFDNEYQSKTGWVRVVNAAN